MYQLRSRLIAILTFAVGFFAASYMQLQPDLPTRFRVLIPPVPKPISELSVPNCGILVVTVGRDLKLELNTDDVGTVADSAELTEKLREIFQQRIDNRAYDQGMEHRPDLPVEKRVMRLVVVKASRSIAYEQVVRTIDIVKTAGADPVGLQLDELPL